MKKLCTIFIMIICVFILNGCTRSMDFVIENEPSFIGVVKTVNDNSILVNVNEDEEVYSVSDLITVSLDVEYEDSMTHFNVGDEVVVYYDGVLLETYPAKVQTVYAITLLTPANRVEPNQVDGSEEWSKDEIIALFERTNAEEDWQIIDCVAVTDGAYDRVGVVLFWDNVNQVSNVAFLDSDGNYQKCGIHAGVYNDSELTYCGNGTVTFKLLTEDGTISHSKITFSITDEKVHFEHDDITDAESEANIGN